MPCGDQDNRIVVPYRAEHYQPTTHALVLERLTDLVAEVAAIRERLDALVPRQESVDEYLTVAEASQHFKLSPAALYRLKHLHCRRGRTIRFKRQDLENHLRPRAAHQRRAS